MGMLVSGDFAIELVEGMTKLRHYLMASRRQSVDARGLATLRLGGAEPAALRHPGQDGIERPWTQLVAVVAQFLEHPLAVDTASVGGVMEDVNLPERQQELPGDRIAHHGG